MFTALLAKAHWFRGGAVCLHEQNSTQVSDHRNRAARRSGFTRLVN
jgi:hypothetical protein